MTSKKYYKGHLYFTCDIDGEKCSDGPFNEDIPISSKLRPDCEHCVTAATRRP